MLIVSQVLTLIPFLRSPRRLRSPLSLSSSIAYATVFSGVRGFMLYKLQRPPQRHATGTTNWTLRRCDADPHGLSRDRSTIDIPTCVQATSNSGQRDIGRSIPGVPLIPAAASLRSSARSCCAAAILPADRRSSVAVRCGVA